MELLDLGENLLRFKTDQKYCVNDWETCSLNLGAWAQRPTQCGYQIYEGKKLTETVEDCIWWDDINLFMTSGAAVITQFNLEEHRNKAKTPVEVWERFEKYINSPEYIIIGANFINFDSQIFRLFCHLIKKPYSNDYLKRTVCVQGLEKAIHLGIKPPKIGGWEWISFNLKMADFYDRKIKTNLRALAIKYGIDYDETKHHVNSSYDVWLTFQIFLKQIQTVELEILV